MVLHAGSAVLLGHEVFLTIGRNKVPESAGFGWEWLKTHDDETDIVIQRAVWGFQNQG
jgi:hypothetical protein